MKSINSKTKLYLGMIAAVLIGIILFMVLTICNYFIKQNKQIAHGQITSYEAILQTKLLYKLNYAREIANAVSTDLSHSDHFMEMARQVVDENNASLVLLIEGEKTLASYPSEVGGIEYNETALADFPYAMTMVNLLKEPTIECPMNLENMESEYFLFIQPVLKDGAFWGQVAVYMEKQYVMNELYMEGILMDGFAYELWHINTNDGSKDVVAISQEGFDFSDGLSIEFYLPGQWTLTIMPLEGWLRPEQIWMTAGIAAVSTMLCAFLMICLARVFRHREYLGKIGFIDIQSGFYNKPGLLRELKRRNGKTKGAFALLYFVVDDFNRIAQICGNDEQERYLNNIKDGVASFINSDHIIGRVGEGNFVVAVFEKMEESTINDVCRGLSIELIWKFSPDNKKNFPSVGYQYIRYQNEGEDIPVLLDAVIDHYYTRVGEQSPVRSLTEKVQQLLKGDRDVVFEEYASTDMMRLSKTINQYRKSVEQLAYQDAVYHVGNRSRYLRDVRMLIAYDKKRSFTLYCFDICSFSKYNELFSVETGDRILREFSQRLIMLFGDNIYRINGDVFLGILLGESDIEQTAEELLAKLKAPIEFDSMRFVLDVKCGICVYPQHARTAEELLEYAQIAVHYAKEHDKEHFTVYNDDLTEILRFEENILKTIEQALKQETLEVWYQPIMNLTTGRFSAVEALLRLSNGEGGYYPADRVIEIAEKYRIVGDIGIYVLQKVCNFAGEFADELGIDYISVNLSVQQLMMDNCVSDIISQLAVCGIQPQRICFEITETFLIQSFDYMQDILIQLTQTGVHVALDDFGSGYSSLNYLSKLPVDVLKIDRLLTQQSIDSKKQLEILKKIVEMAELNGILVVTEGVETEEELEIIREAGMNYIQGYYFSRPIPQPQLIELLAEPVQQRD